MKNVIRFIFSVYMFVCAISNLAAMNAIETKEPFAYSENFFNEYIHKAKIAGEPDPIASAEAAFAFSNRDVTPEDIANQAYEDFIKGENLCSEEWDSVLEVAKQEGALYTVFNFACKRNQHGFIRHMAEWGYEDAQNALEDLEEDITTGIRSEGEDPCAKENKMCKPHIETKIATAKHFLAIAETDGTLPEKVVIHFTGACARGWDDVKKYILDTPKYNKFITPELRKSVENFAARV